MMRGRWWCIDRRQGIPGTQGHEVPLHDGNLSYRSLRRLHVSIIRTAMGGGRGTNLTASTRGIRVILFSLIPIMGDGVSGVLSKTALTASTPCMVANILSNAQGTPPR